MKAFKFLALALAALTLMGCPGEPDSKDFKITVSNVTETTADVLIQPTDSTATYYYSYYEGLTTLTDDSLELLITAELELINQVLAAYGMEMTMTEMLEVLLVKGDIELPLEQLTPGEDYLVVAAKMDYQGVIDGKIAKKNFTTLEAVMGQLTFAFENTGASVIVTPSNDYEPWDYYLLPTADYQEAYNSDKKAAAEDCYAYYGTEYASAGPAEFSFEAIAEQIGTGDMTLLTYACTEEGITSEVAEYQFNVPAPAGAPAKKVSKASIANFKALQKTAKKIDTLKFLKK